MIFLYFIIIVFPIWVIFKFTRNYNILIGSRFVLRYAFYLMCILSVYSLISPLSEIPFSKLELKDSIRIWGYFCGKIAILPFMWNIWEFLYLDKFYTSTHIKNLDYFVLYLRSFDDDKKKRLNERRIMNTFYAFFCPFAVGKPDDLHTYAGSAPRIYLKDDWKDWVLKMMSKTQIILLRVSNKDNFYWEFEQCLLKQYLHKSVFWISDLNSYRIFRERAIKEYKIYFPAEDEVSDNCLFFVDNESFCICKLDKHSSYVDFWCRYNEIRGITNTYPQYFANRSENYIKILCRWKKEPEMPENIQQWSWAGFFFPEYYILIQRFPNRNFTILFFIICFPLWFIIRIPLMFLMGRNGKKVVWLAEKWESKEYFEKIHSINSTKSIAFGVLIFILFFCSFLF